MGSLETQGVDRIQRRGPAGGIEDFEVGGDNDHESAVETLSSVIRRGRAEHQANLAVLACTDFLTLHADIVKRVGGCVIEPATTAVRALELQLDIWQAKRAGAAA